MSDVFFEATQEFKCPCGCGKRLRLTLKKTDEAGWETLVTSGSKTVCSLEQDI